MLRRGSPEGSLRSAGRRAAPQRSGTPREDTATDTEGNRSAKRGGRQPSR